MTPSLEGLPTKTKEAPYPHKVRLTLLGTNPVFQCLEDAIIYLLLLITIIIAIILKIIIIDFMVSVIT